MTSLTDQLSAVRQSQWEAQLDIFRTLTSRALDSTEQLINLNLRASRTSVEQVTGTFKQLLDAASPHDLIAVTSRAQGQWHYLFSYGRELLGIAGGAQGGTWSTQSALQALTAPLQLMTAPTANIPTSFSQALDQASIATAQSTTVTTEIAAAAVDTGAALAQATLHAGSEAAAAAASAAGAPAVEAAPVPEPTPDPAQADEVVQQFEAAIEKAATDDVPPAKPTLLAAALNEIAPKPASAEHPVASTLPLETPDQIELPSVTPVDAAPPVHVAVPPVPPVHSSKAPRASRSRK